jgi:hypothetical protein
MFLHQTATTIPPPTTLAPSDVLQAISDLNSLDANAAILKNELEVFSDPPLVSSYLNRDNELLALVHELKTNLPYTTLSQISDAIATYQALQQEATTLFAKHSGIFPELLREFCTNIALSNRSEQFHQIGEPTVYRCQQFSGRQLSGFKLHSSKWSLEVKNG